MRKKLMILALLAVYGGMVVGCDSDNSAKHETTQERTVTDQNGNVVSHTESKTDTTTNNPPPPNNNP